uniref:Uncharacterized protein n=1 Tax=Cucumis melo TaxID=3656 RepID=A0A9I9EK48_CUCME
MLHPHPLAGKRVGCSIHPKSGQENESTRVTPSGKSASGAARGPLQFGPNMDYHGEVRSKM